MAVCPITSCTDLASAIKGGQDVKKAIDVTVRMSERVIDFWAQNINTADDHVSTEHAQ